LRTSPLPSSSGSITAQRITKRFGASLVLREVSLSINPGTRIGVVGPNGIGKSTLLRLLGGLEEPDEGTVTRAPDLRVGLLPQEINALPGEQLLDYLARRAGVTQAKTTVDELAATMGDDLDAIANYTSALDRWLALGGADLEARAAVVCAEVGLGSQLRREVAALSGGEAARAALAAVLLARFDVFLLDEPTNNLDFEGLARLETFVTELRGGLVVTSHDRVFLERCVDAIVEIEDGSRRAVHYGGGYAHFLRARAERQRRQRDDYARYVAERGRLRERARVQKEWARQGAARARKAPKDPDRFSRASHVAGAQASAAKAPALERRMERLEPVEAPWIPWRLELSFEPTQRAGDLVVGLYDAVLRRGAFSLGPVDLEILWRDRVAVTGLNGSGKTTLLAALMGALPLAQGRRVMGRATMVGELDQARARFSVSRPLLEAFCNDTNMPPEAARSLLAKFDLRSDDVGRTAASLSAGERTRAALAALVAKGVNFLLLDEPTNHLDLEAIEQLEEALRGFEGTSLLITHDRRLLERLEPTRWLGVEAGRVLDYGINPPGGRGP
jgi:ATPase subunit of ABC transporter with duplicated ATPase domains